MSRIRILNFGPEWECAHFEFANTYFNGRRKRTNAEYIYWKFRGEQGKELNSFLIALDQNRVVGQLGLIPCEVVVNQNVYQAQWACDLMVDKDFRGKGIASRLYKEAVSRKITLGSDPSPSAAISMKRFGFISINGPRKLFFPILLSSITDKKLKALSFLAKKVPNPFMLLYFLKRIILFKKKDKWQSLSIDELNNLLPNKIYKNTATIRRDQQFYNWRLGSFKDYQSAGNLYKSENTILATRSSKTTTFIADLTYVDKKSIKSAIVHFLIQAFKSGCSELKIMTGDNKLISYLKSMGFLSFRTLTTIIYYSENQQFLSDMKDCTYFNYTYLDSDENI